MFQPYNLPGTFFLLYREESQTFYSSRKYVWNVKWVSKCCKPSVSEAAQVLCVQCQEGQLIMASQESLEAQVSTQSSSLSCRYSSWARFQPLPFCRGRWGSKHCTDPPPCRILPIPGLDGWRMTQERVGVTCNLSWSKQISLQGFFVISRISLTQIYNFMNSTTKLLCAHLTCV